MQDVNNKSFGAFTGDHSPEMLASLGLKWAITGHSERRAYHGETNELVGEKTKFAIEKGISCIAVGHCSQRFP